MASQNISIQFYTFQRLQKYVETHRLNSKTEAIEKLLDEAENS